MLFLAYREPAGHSSRWESSMDGAAVGSDANEPAVVLEVAKDLDPGEAQAMVADAFVTAMLELAERGEREGSTHPAFLDRETLEARGVTPDATIA